MYFKFTVSTIQNPPLIKCRQNFIKYSCLKVNADYITADNPSGFYPYKQPDQALRLRKAFEKEWLWQGKLCPTETFYRISEMP